MFSSNKEIRRMFVMMFIVFVVFAIGRQMQNSQRTNFAMQAERIVIYNVSRAEAMQLSAVQLAQAVAIEIDDPQHFFVSMTYIEDPIEWTGDYYAEFYLADGQLLSGRFSSYGYLFEVSGKAGKYRFKLADEDNWLFY